MSDREARALLLALYESGALTEEEARSLYAEWAAGRITDADLPDAPLDAGAFLAVLLASLAGLAIPQSTRDRLLGPVKLATDRILAAVRSRFGPDRAILAAPGRPAVDLTSLTPLAPGQPSVRDALARDLLDIQAREIRRRTALLFAPPDGTAADRLSRGSVRRWQAALRQAAAEDLATFARLGFGRPLTNAEAQALLAEAVDLGAYTDRTAAYVSRMRAGLAPVLTEAQIAASYIRTVGGRVGAAFWRAAVTVAASDPDMVAHFEGYDAGVRGPCSPCLAAERGSPYLASDPGIPLPKVVCRGLGHCRHYLRFESSPAVAARLRGRTARRAA